MCSKHRQIHRLEKYAQMKQIKPIGKQSTCHHYDANEQGQGMFQCDFNHVWLKIMLVLVTINMITWQIFISFKMLIQLQGVKGEKFGFTTFRLKISNIMQFCENSIMTKYLLYVFSESCQLFDIMPTINSNYLASFYSLKQNKTRKTCPKVCPKTWVTPRRKIFCC